MRLRELKIQGFKSFLRPTRLNFSEGISAIIGPNGCGKSNIVDAIKWVIGEQSAKQLRGRSMEDVIFCGAPGKKPIGMAEVSLIVSNGGDGYWPRGYEDVHEIMITRRLFRSGESHYFINKRPCRLKDIVNLFLGTGVGSKAYAIIEQGRVSRLLEARPEEVRLFIEEVADITRFRSRRAETLRKLGGVENNLQRLQDILNEIERQLTTLKRQATRAKRYKIIKEELLNIETRLYVHRLRNIIDQLNITRDRLRKAEDSDALCSKKIGNIERELLQLRNDLSQKEEKFSMIKEEVGRIEAKIEGLEQEYSHLVNIIKQMTRQRSHIKEELSRDHKRYDELKGKRETIWSEIKEKQKDLLSLEKKIEKEFDALKKREEDFQHIGLKREETKTRLVEIISKITHIKNRIVELKKRKEQKINRIERRRDEVNEIKREQAELKNRHTFLQEKLTELEKRDNIFSKDLERQRATISSSKKGLKDLDPLIRDMKREIDRIEAKISVTERLIHNYNWSSDAVKEVLKGNLSQKVKLLADTLLYVPKRLEAAVFAILGDTLHHGLIVSKNPFINEILSFVEQKERDKNIILIPAGLLKDESLKREIPHNAELLISSIKVKEEFSHIIKRLLGDVILVETIEQAITLWLEDKWPGRIVTEDGKIIMPPGYIISGREEGVSNSMLSAKREINEAGKQLLSKRKELNEIEQKRIALVKEIRVARKKEEEIREAIGNLQKDKNAIEREIEKIEVQLESIKNREEFYTLEERELTEEIESIENDIRKLEEETKNISIEETNLRISLASKEKEYENLKRELAELRRNNQTLILEKERYSANIEQFELELKSIEAEVSRIKERVDRNSNLLLTIDEEEKKALIRKESIREEIPLLHESLEKKRELLELVSKDITSLRSRIQKKEEELKGLNRELRDIQENTNAIKVDISKLEIEKEHLVKNLQETNENVDMERVPPLEMREEEAENKIINLRKRLKRLGPVNMEAVNEYNELNERHRFLKAQEEDLKQASDDLKRAIKRIDRTCRKRFLETFDKVNRKYQEVLPILWEGGKGKLELQGDDPLLAGVTIEAQPPGKKLTSLSLLSGGEKALTALAFLISLYLVRPSPFYLLDEVDAHLDEANVQRFVKILQEMVKDSQLIVITHNRQTMKVANTLFGVTMEEPGVSKLFTLKMSEVEKDYENIWTKSEGNRDR